MTANDQPVRPTALSAWPRVLLLALLLAAFCGFNIFMNPLGLAVDSDDIDNVQLQMFLFIGGIGIVLAEPMLVASWMAFVNLSPDKRISIGLLVILLNCVTVAIGVYIVEGRVNNEVLSFPLLLAVEFAIVLLAFMGVRRWTRWRLDLATDRSQPRAAPGQFGIRSVLIWTVEIGLLAGLFSSLYRRLPTDESRNWGLGEMVGMVLAGALLSLPVVTSAWLLLGRGRGIIFGGIATLVALGVTVGTLCGIMILSGESDLGDGALQLGVVIAGAMLVSAFVYFILRGCGYRMIRTAKEKAAAVPTSDTAVAFVGRPSTSHRLRWQWATAMVVALAACASIGWRASYVVPQRMQEAVERRWSQLELSPTYDDNGKLTVLTLKAHQRLDEPRLRAIEQLDPIPTLNLAGNPNPTPQLSAISQLAHVRGLFLYQSGVGDSDMGLVAKLTELETLNISNTRVTDAGFVELSKLKNLQQIVASNTTITDASLALLHDMKSLLSVDVRSTGVTAEGIEKLRAAQPKLKIQWE